MLSLIHSATTRGKPVMMTLMKTMKLPSTPSQGVKALELSSKRVENRSRDWDLDLDL